MIAVEFDLVAAVIPSSALDSPRRTGELPSYALTQLASWYKALSVTTPVLSIMLLPLVMVERTYDVMVVM